MVEPEDAPALTLDELLGLAGNDDGREPETAEERMEKDSEAVLLQLFGGLGEQAAEPAEPAVSSPRTTPAATLASLFGMETEPVSTREAVRVDEVPAFDLFAAFGGSPATGGEAVAASVLQGARPSFSSERTATFDLADALGVKPIKEANEVEEAKPAAQEEARPLRGRFANLGARPSASGLEPKSSIEPRPSLKPAPEPESSPISEPRAEEKQQVKSQADAPATFEQRVKPLHPALAGKPAPSEPFEKPASGGKLARKEAPASSRGTSEKPMPVAPRGGAEGLAGSEASRQDVSSAHAAFDSRIARKRLPASTVASQPQPIRREEEKAAGRPAVPMPASDARKREDCESEREGSSAPKATFEKPVSSESNPVRKPASKPEAQAPLPASVPAHPTMRASVQQEMPDAGREGRGRKLVFAGISLAAVAALAGSIALAVALDGGSAAVRGESTPLAALGAGSDRAEAGTVEYRYKVMGSGPDAGQAVERASFGEDGFLSRSEIEVEFPDAEQAHAFLDEARAAFGDALLDGSVEGSSTRLVVDAQGEPVDRLTYTELLRRDTIDCETM